MAAERSETARRRMPTVRQSVFFILSSFAKFEAHSQESAGRRLCIAAQIIGEQLLIFGTKTLPLTVISDAADIVIEK